MPFTTSSAAWLLPVTPNTLPPAAPAPEHPLDSYETEIRALCVTVLVWTERIVWSEARSQPTCKIHFPLVTRSTSPMFPPNLSLRIVFMDKIMIIGDYLMHLYLYMGSLYIGVVTDIFINDFVKAVDKMVYISILINYDVKYGVCVCTYLSFVVLLFFWS